MTQASRWTYALLFGVARLIACKTVEVGCIPDTPVLRPPVTPMMPLTMVPVLPYPCALP
ncbi:MAG: hypothetical protein ACUVSY_17800 [Roseiflexus sp.]